MKKTLLLSLIGLTPALRATQPNILIILADDMSYRDLSCYGQTKYQTPNIDSLAAQSVRFTQSYAVAPESAPSRCGLLTGKHTGHSSVRLNSSARGQEHLLDSDLTIAEALKQQGYATAMVGKWGVGLQESEGVPYKQGFDYSFGFYDQTEAHSYIPDYMFENERRIDYPQNKGFDMLRRYNYKGHRGQNSYDAEGFLYIPELKDPKGYAYSDNEIEQAAMRFLDRHLNGSSEQPFLLYYATQLPHGPMIVDQLGEMAQPDSINQLSREWGAMVMRLDRTVGKLIAKLKAGGAYDNTLIIFASDNGYSMCGYTERGNGPDWADDPYLKNKGSFRGGKFTPLEGGLRVPLFISYPQRFDAKVLSTPVWLADLFPTLVEMAKAPAVEDLDGQSLVTLMTQGYDAALSNRPLYFSRGAEQSVRMGAYSIYKPNKDAPSQLYLVEEDAYQEHDLSAYFPQIVRQAEAIMSASLTPHPWFWTPAESRAEYQQKVERAKSTNNLLPINRPNGIDLFPWERKRH